MSLTGTVDADLKSQLEGASTCVHTFLNMASALRGVLHVCLEV